jgi:DNA-damage-inducible protein D
MQEIRNYTGIFRIIQSIPSPKAEPFKWWLAKVGYERVQEIEDSELASQRVREIYKAKGYDDAWIEKRMRDIQVWAELTEEWKKRNVGNNLEYTILTAEISKATFLKNVANCLIYLVARGRIELPTRGFSVREIKNHACLTI